MEAKIHRPINYSIMSSFCGNVWRLLHIPQWNQSKEGEQGLTGNEMVNVFFELCVYVPYLYVHITKGTAYTTGTSCWLPLIPQVLPV